jgi:hypothetical protein
MPTRPPQAKAQTIFAIKAMNTLMIHLPALPAERKRGFSTVSLALDVAR